MFDYKLSQKVFKDGYVHKMDTTKINRCINCAEFIYIKCHDIWMIKIIRLLERIWPSLARKLRDREN